MSASALIPIAVRAPADQSEAGIAPAPRSETLKIVATEKPIPEQPATVAATPTGLSAAQIKMLSTGLLSSLLVSTSAQFVTTNLADIQGAVAATADEASWIATVYTMASFTGIVVSGVSIKTFGLSRYLFVNSIVFGLMALFCAWSSSLQTIVALRAIQGAAAGGFGPLAFVVVFTVMGGRRLPFGLLLLSFVLLFPLTLGPVMAAYIENSFGWRGLFGAQVLVGLVASLAALAWFPRQPINWAGLKTDWTAVVLLSAGLAFLILVLSQGTRRFWFESDIIVWSTIAGAGAWAGFIFLARFSPLPIISPRLLLARRFGIPIALNLVFRAGFAVTTYLIPQFLAVVQGYRPLEIAQLLSWGLAAQALTLPVTWWLLHRLDSRMIMGLGLFLCGVGAFLLANETALSAGDQFWLAVVVFSAAQLMFLAPDLWIGSASLTPAGLPTASLAFNMTTLGGTTLGTALVSNLVTERQKFHSNVLTENVSLYNNLDFDRISALSNAFANRLTDETIATARAIAVLASAARKEAWVLSFNDAFITTAIILAISAIGVVFVGRSPPLSRQ